MSDTCAALPEKPEAQLVLPRTIHLIPMDHINGFDVRPGFYEINWRHRHPRRRELHCPLPRSHGH